MSDSFVAAREVERKERSRVFQMSDELVAQMLFDWSPPVQLYAKQNEDGTYELIARTIDEADPER